MNDTQKDIEVFFKKNNYVLIRNFLDQNTANLFYAYCLTRVQQIDFKSQHAKQNYDKRWDGEFGDEQAPSSFNSYGDPLMDTLMASSIGTIEKFTGLSLIPEYTYWRLYVKNEDLKRHKDRESCEVSVTLCLGHNISNLQDEKFVGYTWPMFVEGNVIDELDGIPLHMKPGDMIIYKGCEIEHWREKFQGLNLAQVFMHYNDAAGPYQIKNDGRPILGIPKYYQTAI